MKKNPDLRTQNDLKKLAPLLSVLEFFQKQNFKEKEMSDICMGLEFQECLDGEIIFNYGDEGDKFYLIIDGCASVWFPVVKQTIIEPLKRFQEQLG